MFQIMTEEQIKAADEETLRQRVRDLSVASRVLHEIAQRQETASNILANAVLVLRDIEAHTRAQCAILRIIEQNVVYMGGLLTGINKSLLPKQPRKQKRRAKR